MRSSSIGAIDMPKKIRVDKKCVPEPGDWVLLRGDIVIACGKDVSKLLDMAQAGKPGELVISKEPRSKYYYFGTVPQGPDPIGKIQMCVRY